MRRGRRWARRGTVLVLAGLLAACGAGGAEDDAGGTTTTAPASTTASSSTTTSTSTSTTTTSTTTTTTAPPAEPESLAAGAEGPRTRALQEKLKALKFDPGPVDGQFGTKTTMAVWAYEALNGVPQDGVVDPMLEAHIQQATQPPGMLRPDLGPTHTEVDLDKQVMLVFRDGGLQLVTHVSTGNGQQYCENGHCGVAVTPPGEFRYQRRIEGWRDAPLGRLYNPVYFNGGIAVHGAGSVPAQPASHGCVRIPMHIAEYFPGLVVNGEPISVFNGGTGVAAAVAPPAPGSTPAAPPDTLAGG